MGLKTKHSFGGKMSYYLIYNETTKDLISIGTVIGEPLPDNMGWVEITEEDFYHFATMQYEWDGDALTFEFIEPVYEPTLEEIIDGIVDLNLPDAIIEYMVAHPPEPGEDGQPGKSAYQIWLDAGNSGNIAVFLASLKGAKGDTGDQGLQGIQGIQGVQGNPASAPTFTQRKAKSASPLLLLNIPVDITLTWSTPFANTNYEYFVFLDSLIASTTNWVQKSKAVDKVVITLTATVGVSANANGVQAYGVGIV